MPNKTTGFKTPDGQLLKEITKTTLYETVDGQLFEEETAAISHERGTLLGSTIRDGISRAVREFGGDAVQAQMSDKFIAWLAGRMAGDKVLLEELGKVLGILNVSAKAAAPKPIRKPSAAGAAAAAEAAAEARQKEVQGLATETGRAEAGTTHTPVAATPETIENLAAFAEQAGLAEFQPDLDGLPEGGEDAPPPPPPAA
jgi:hypothetical protein